MDVFEWRPATERGPWTEDAVIRAALAIYQMYVSAEYRVTDRPERMNRKAPEIDAIAEAPGMPALAIEHTRVESFTDQRTDDARVDDLLGTFQLDLAPELPHGLSCIIPTHAFTAGFNWKAVRARLAEFLRSLDVAVLRRTQEYTVPHVPFRIIVSYQPDLRVGFRFFRAAPAADVVAAALRASVEKALAHKRDQLADYRSRGYRTVLLLESNDNSLVSHIEPYKAFLRAERAVGSTHASDVLFAASGDPHCVYWFGFKGDRAFLDSFNPSNLRLGPHFGIYWSRVLLKESAA